MKQVFGPVVIGGVGGSGTRIAAEIVSGLGIFIGHDLPQSKDNLFFSRMSDADKELFQYPISDPDRLAARESPWLSRFEQHMEEERLRFSPESLGWGFKIPPIFFLLQYLCDHFPGMRYIHVMRHGLDMAFSRNRNQLRDWGPRLGVTTDDLNDPRAAFQYWVRANHIAIAESERLLGPRFMLLRFESLCEQPEATIRSVAEFLELASSTYDLDSLATLVSTPDTIGRYRREGRADIFTAEDLSALRELAYTF